MLAFLAQTTYSTSANGSSGGLAAVFAGLLLFELIVGGFVLFAWVRIVQKAGYSGWWVLAALIPIVGIVLFFVFAFSRWPALENVRRPGPGNGYGGYGGGGFGPGPAPGFGPPPAQTFTGPPPTRGFAPARPAAPQPAPPQPQPPWGPPPQPPAR